MCVAVILPKGSNTPTIQDLEKMHKTNPHGAGVAWVHNGLVHWHKGLDNMVQLHNLLSDIPRPTLLHFRLSSIGGTSPNLCHPFPIERNPSTKLKGQALSVMIHNGHWSGHNLAQLFLDDYKPGKRHSDTRVMAHLAVTRPDILKHIAKQGQRFAILQSNKVVLQYGDWTESADGTRYSNMYWNTPKPTVTITQTVEEYVAHYQRRTVSPPSYERMSDAEYDALMKECDNA